MIDLEVDDSLLPISLNSKLSGDCIQDCPRSLGCILRYLAAAISLREGKTLTICLFDNIAIYI